MQTLYAYFGSDDQADIVQSDVDLVDNITSLLVVAIANPELNSAPSALTVSVGDALGPEDLIFEIDGYLVFQYPTSSFGTLEFASIPVPNVRVNNVEVMQPGVHTLTVKQGVHSEGSATFTLVNPPEQLVDHVGPDTDPVPVPGAIQPNSVRRWVFQDLMPGGLGSWVLPMNPADVESPPLAERTLVAQATTASDEDGGQFHVYEDPFTPTEWEFGGYCPTAEMRETIEAYHELNRRWYLHDHRGRAWKVTSRDLSMEARRSEYWNGELNHEGHDYKMVLLVLEPAVTV